MITWHNGPSADAAYALMKRELAEALAKACPGHDLSHFGISRDPHTDEVKLVLHLRPVEKSGDIRRALK